MAPAAVKAWKHVLVMLEQQQAQAQAQSQQTDSPAACQVPYSYEIDTHYIKVQRLEMVPRAAWKKIVNDLEVRHSARTAKTQRAYWTATIVNVPDATSLGANQPPC